MTVNQSEDTNNKSLLFASLLAVWPTLSVVSPALNVLKSHNDRGTVTWIGPIALTL